MKIAYIILVHKNPEQLMRLVSRLNSSEASFFIHIDKKTKNEVYQQFVNGLDHLPNVYFLKRYLSRWGEFGLVRATLEGIGEVLRRQPSAGYVALLTGQDYPIKTNDYISTFLERSAGRSYLDLHPVPCRDWPEAATRLRSWHVRMLGKPFLLPRRNAGLVILRTPRKWPIHVLSYCMPKKRRPLRGYTPYTGSAQWVMSKACAQYVDEFVKREVSFVRYFKYVCCPDELFFQIVLGNSELAESNAGHNLHHTDWCMGGAHPAVMTVDDLAALVGSPALYARKFDPDVDETIYRLIDETILGGPPYRPADA